MNKITNSEPSDIEYDDALDLKPYKIESLNTIDIGAVEYGSYMLEDKYDEMNENFKYDTAEFDKLYMRKLRLPDANGHIVYIMSADFDSALKMLDRSKFVIPPSYRRVFIPLIMRGTFMNRRFAVNNRSVSQERTKMISQTAKLMQLQAMKLNKFSGNMFYITSDLYEAVSAISTKFPIKRLYSEFFRLFMDIIESYVVEVDSYKRMMIIDSASFKFSANSKLADNKTNPLFLMYMAFFRTKNMQVLDIDIDIVICHENAFIKFNPAKIDYKQFQIFKRALFKIMNANIDDYIDSLEDDEKSSAEDDGGSMMADIDKSTSQFTVNSSDDIKSVLNSSIEDKIQTMMSVTRTSSDNNDKVRDLFNDIVNDEDALGAAKKDAIDTKSVAKEILSNDEDVKAKVADEVQDKVVSLKDIKTAPVNSPRDIKLREAQKKLLVKKSTISEIMEKDANNIPIKSEDKSKTLKMTNANMKNVTFANFEKTYLDELYVKDVLSCFDMLKDKEPAFYITGVDIKDTSTSDDYKETWTVNLTDQYKKRSTIKVDIPKFHNDRFMLLGGNKYMILKQNFYNPLVKDTPDTVIMTTNYNKVTINRKSTKSLAYIERIFRMMKKMGANDDTFTSGDSTKGNLAYISTLEYDELAKRLFRFKTDKCEIIFARKYIQENMDHLKPKDLKGDEFIIGVENNIPIIINENTGRDRLDRTIVEIMESHLPEDMKTALDSTKFAKQTMYVEAKMAGQMLPVACILCVWIGISNLLNKMNIAWKFVPGKRIPKTDDRTRKYIKFSNGYVEYESQTFAELILAGMSKMNPERYTFEQFDSEEGYGDFIYSAWGDYAKSGSYSGITELKAFHQFLMDPITKDVCRDLSLPDDAEGLLIHAVKLLCDNAYVSKASDKSYRVRSIETVPAILYSCIAAQYKNYMKSSGRIPMTLNQRVVISKLQAEKTVDEYSTLNPTTEVAKTHTISTKGYRGSNSEHSYDEEKRSYDPSSIGKIAMSTSNDANVGINKEVVIEPTISNVRGYRDQVDDINNLKDVNLFSPVEMLTPGTVRNEDPIRVAIAGKQSQHVVPVEEADLTLVSNGFDEAIQYHLSDDFVVNALEDGEVIEINDDLGFMVVKYASGQTQAVYIKPDVVKNSGGGFYIANTLKPVFDKVGDKFKKDEPLAYHDKYFKYSKLNGLRFVIGPMTKMAFMSSYNSYEDAGICTAKLADKMKTKIVYQETASFKGSTEILSIVNIGDHVGIGDPLMRFGSSIDDSEISKFLSKLSEDNVSVMEEETNNEVKSHHAGTIIDIKVFSLLEPDNLSPSLKKIVKAYFDKGVKKDKFLTKHDPNSEGIVKAGYMLRDNTKPTVSRYNSIKGQKGIDVLIEFYIEHDDVMGVGDKIALYSANKQIISEVIPEGMEPYSEFRPDEEISVITSPGTIARRMTPSIIQISTAMKCMIELKRKIADMIEF